MKVTPVLTSFCVLLLLLSGMSFNAVAQSIRPANIRPANDGTGTRVNRQGDRYQIEGGRRSRDQRNLFHSFEQFGLNRTETAEFLSRPEIQNVFTRVTGGNASVIDGLIQLTGGNSNLYLINPAGLIFGRNARLDLPAAFTATSASGIGLDGGWFSAIATNNYDALIGNATNFAFALDQPGVVVNAGNLAVAPGQNLTLLGGTVVNTGQLTAPGGQITVMAVPGQSRVRISQANSPLSIELEPLSSPEDGTVPFTPLTLPQLLTGGELQTATGLTVAADGSVKLASGTTIPNIPGSVVISGVVDTSSSNASSSASSNAATSGIRLLGDRVGLFSATIDASAPNGGGTILIGGDYQGQGTTPRADVTVVDRNSRITANATNSGNGGRVILWSDLDTTFSGEIIAQGGLNSGNGGFVEVSSNRRLGFHGSVDVNAWNGSTGMLLLDPEDIVIRSGSGDGDVNGDDDTFGSPLGEILATSPVTVLFESELENLPGSPGITIQATRNIIIEALSDNSLDLRISPGESIQLIADSDQNGVGTFSMASTNTLRADTVGLGAPANLIIRGAEINVGAIDTTSVSDPGNGNATNVTLSTRAGSSLRGSITASSITATARRGNGGAVLLEGDTIQLTDPILPSIDVSATARSLPGNPGSVQITHNGGASNLPFQVGQASANGTVGAIRINTGSFVNELTTGSFPMQPTGGTTTPIPGFNLTTINAAPNTPPTPSALVADLGESITVRVADLLPQLNNLDPDQDNIAVQINQIDPNITIQRGGINLTANTILQPNDLLVLSPNSAATGTIPAFSFRLVDVNNGSVNPFLSSSNSVDVSLAIAAPPEPPPTVEIPDDPVEQLLPPEDPAPYTPITFTESTPPPEAPPMIAEEGRFSEEFNEFAGGEGRTYKTIDEVKQLAIEIADNTGEKPAFIYLSFVPSGIPLATETIQPQDSDQLEVLLVTATQVIRQRIPNTTRKQVLELANTFRSEVTDPRKLGTTSYLPQAKQFYDWLIRPIQSSLTEQEITNLVFLPDRGLRSLPFAAMHNGEQFIIANYSVGLMPSLSLTDTRYVGLKGTPILAMGISEPIQGQLPLPAVPTELETIADQIPNGRFYLNADSTITTLRRIRQEYPFGIVHLATHANFLRDQVQTETDENAYIQFWNERLPLSRVRELGWNDPPVELLVLSACKTAVGNDQAELGFAGLAIQTGVKSVVASLWSVNDSGTASLMAGFYRALGTSPIKAEALRQAQWAIASGNISIANGQINGIADIDDLTLPDPSLNIPSSELSHPYYWAAFTLIGNPW